MLWTCFKLVVKIFQGSVIGLLYLHLGRVYIIVCYCEDVVAVAGLFCTHVKSCSIRKLL